MAVVLANCTDRLQPVDVNVSRASEEFLRGQFQVWYLEQVCQQLKKGSNIALKPVDLRMSVKKLLGAKWMTNLYDYMKKKPDIVRN